MDAERNRTSHVVLALLLGIAVVFGFCAGAGVTVPPLLGLPAVWISLSLYIAALMQYVMAKGYSALVSALFIPLGFIGVIVSHLLPNKRKGASGAQQGKASRTVMLSVWRFLVLFAFSTGAPFLIIAEVGGLLP